MITVPADPSPYAFDPTRTALVCIDFQRDFVEPGGFGETLGNDVSTLRSAIVPTERVLDCPCHEGRFDATDGGVVHGPPPRPLPVIELEERSDGIYAVGATP